MPVIPQELTKLKLLIGEGKDEVQFFTAILKHLDIKDIQIEDYGGKSKLAAYLATLNEPRPGFRDVVSLGITRDADSNSSDAFRSVCNSLKRAGLPVPSAPLKVAGDELQVKVFILPDCVNAGMLEDLCVASIQNDPAFACIDEYFSCVQSAAQRRPTSMSKARVHAWLATHPDSDLRLGEAAQRDIWNWDSPAFEDLKKFLQQL